MTEHNGEAELAVIRDAIDRADIVSFDVFDTLLDRPFMRPTDTFAAQARIARARYALPVTDDWPDQRIKAEHDLYGDPLQGPHITIDDIYDALEARFAWPHDMAEQLKRIELELEAATLQPTHRGAALFAYAKQAGKTVLITSDMYVSPEFLGDVLRSRGLGAFDEIEVSGYSHLAKWDGGIYRHYVRRFPGKRIVHIGDKQRDDVDMARDCGLDACLLPRPVVQDDRQHGNPVALFERLAQEDHQDYTDTRLTASLNAGLAQRDVERAPDSPAAERIGYSVLGPLLYGFARFLDDASRRDGIERLFFLSREGSILQTAYRTVLGDHALQSSYLHASRRMLMLPTLHDPLTSNDYDFLTITGTPLTAYALVARFFPDDAAHGALIRESFARHEQDPDQIVDAWNRYQALVPVFDELRDALMEQAHAARQNVSAYLHDAGVGEHSGIVDVGWQATMQQSIAELTGVPLRGYYYGLLDTGKTRGRADIAAFLDARAGQRTQDFVRTIEPYTEVTEALFGNTEEPSSIGVQRTGTHEWEPIFSGERLAGTAAQTIRSVQQGALRFLRDRQTQPAEIPIDPLGSVEPLRTLLLEPTAVQAALLGAIEHDNTYGLKPEPLGMPLHERAYYDEHADERARERELALWKPGFDVNLEHDAHC